MSGGVSGATTAIGTGVGAYFGGPMGAAAGAMVGNSIGGMIDNAGMAKTQGDIANAQLGQEREDRNLTMSMLAPSASDIAQLQQAIAVNNQQITQAQHVLDATDPTIISAAHQANSLLNGGSSPLLAPIQNQRAQQRQQLQQQLQQQLGPGYATSSAGIQALNNFDQQTSNVMTNAQQSTLAQLLGTTQYGSSMGTSRQQAGIANSTGFAQGNSILYGGEANAITKNPVNPGLGYAGQLGAAQGSMANSGMLLGGILGGVGAYAGAKGTTNTTVPSSGGGGSGPSPNFVQEY